MVGHTNSRNRIEMLQKCARFGKRPLQRHFPLGWALVRDAG